MKQLIFFLFVISFTQHITLSAQKQVLFRDDFDKDDGSWFIVNDASSYFKIENGFYILQDKDTTQRWYCWRDIDYFTHKLDFEIEVKLRLKSGSAKSAFGLAWGLADLKNLNTFGLTGDGKFFIQTKVANQYTSQVEQTFSKQIKGTGNFNILKIKGNKQELLYFINDSLIYSSTFPTLKGANLGFLVDKNSIIEVDYVIVKQDVKMNLIDNPVKGRLSRPIERINTTAYENTPLISADGKTLYFSRNEHPENTGKDKNSDIWFSKKDSDGNFSIAQSIGRPLNNDGNNFIVYLSPDEHTFILANQYNDKGEIKSQGLSISHLESNGWSMPKDIVVEDFKNLSKYVEYGFSSNRKVLISSIQNENSIGDNDLYVSFQIDEKTYSKPINMGSIINTLHDDNFPVLSPDGKKLYFSSEGHPGYGKFDIFVSERKDDSWLNWSTPKNLGPEINSSANEMGFHITQLGDVAYFTSNRNSKNKLDIFEFYTEEKKIDSTCIFTGVVTDAVTGKALAAEITFFTAPKHKEILLTKSNPTDGSFKGSLPTHMNYDFYGIKKGYYGVTNRIQLEFKEENISSYQITMKLYPLQKGLIVPMPNISFDASVNPTTYASYELERLLHLLEEYPNLVIQLNSPANATDNGTKQLESIKNYLVSRGIKANRIPKFEKSKTNDFEFKIISTEQFQEIVTIQNSFSTEIKVNEIKKGQSFKIENLYFLADSSSFTTTSAQTLNELAQFLLTNKNIKVEIGGHTNGLPAHEYCDQLSNNRAKSVFLYLLSKGVSEKLISFKGYGKRVPVADNSTEEGRAKNQRVELKVLDIL